MGTKRDVKAGDSMGQVQVLSGVIAIGLLLLFGVSYFRERRQLRNGVWLNGFFIAGGIWLLTSAWGSGNPWLLVPVLLVDGLLVLALLLGIYGVIIFLLYNAHQVWRREAHSLTNLLGLLLAIGLSGLVVWQALIFGDVLPPPLMLLFSFVPVLVGYAFLNFWNYLTISLVYQLHRPRYRQQAIVVLGAGLLNGTEISGLLASRIKRGVTFYQKQIEKGRPAPLLVFSGGQGPDEKLPEALAMQRYAVEKLQVPEKDTAVELQSTNTRQNMAFSARLIQQRFGPRYRAIFVSNGYHIFRAGLLARQVGFNAQGIGAHTAGYFLPNAFLREFAAIMVLHKRLHLRVAAVVVSLAIIQCLLALA